MTEDEGRELIVRLNKSLLGPNPFTVDEAYMIKYVEFKCWKCLPGSIKLMLEDMAKKLTD